ncbi:MAG TPA: DUF2171 domain-containing protein [Sphingomicrobium sp.]|nr:DUF2171 domain-containing protein [Sphingomicrobium sp.]
MAYDRYDTRRDPRDRWRAQDRSDRERGMRDRDERGFFERAGDEIASWFGDEDDERRRRQDMSRHELGHFARERDLPPRGQSCWDRGEEDRGMVGTSSYRGYGGEGRESSGRMWSAGRSDEPERGYRPMTGDYGLGERPDFSRGEWGQSRPISGGARERSHDPHYAEWRNRQIEELDRDYDDYRRENQSRFESDFGEWRSKRQAKRQLLGQVRDHMEVVGADNQRVGTVDRVAGDKMILTRSDEEAGGAHHSVPCTMIDRIEDNQVILDCDAEQAKKSWRDESRDRALFEREDQGEAGAHMLNRSFSGTYR